MPMLLTASPLQDRMAVFTLSMGNSPQSLLIPEPYLGVSGEVLSGPGQNHPRNCWGDLVVETTSSRAWTMVALVNLLECTAVETAHTWNQLQPCFQSVGHQVSFKGLKETTFYMLNSPHPSAFLPFLVIAFPLEKYSVLLKDTASRVH